MGRSTYLLVEVGLPQQSRSEKVHCQQSHLSVEPSTHGQKEETRVHRVEEHEMVEEETQILYL